MQELRLWFFDSRGGFQIQEWDDDRSPVGQENWVDVAAVDWPRQTNAELVHRYQKVIPSLGFVHIRTFASVALQSEAGVYPHRQPGINYDWTRLATSPGLVS